MSMSRRTRKQIVGKTENYEMRERERALCQLWQELRWLWQWQLEDSALYAA
jgi:hypothetical protein